MTHRGERGGLCGPLTPRLAEKGPQGVVKRPADRLSGEITKSMPMRPQGGTPGGFPSKTPRAKGGR